MHLISIVALAFSSNLDNFGVGVAYGMKRTCISVVSNLVIALIGGGGTLLSMLAGSSIYYFIKPESASLAGGITIMLIGIWMIIQQRNRLPRTRQENTTRKSMRSASMRKMFDIVENPLSVDPDCTGDLTVRQSILLGFGLTVNNLANGVAAGMLGLNKLLLTSCAVIFSILAVSFGRAAGTSYSTRWFGRLAGPLSGLLLISIGVYEIFAKK